MTEEKAGGPKSRQQGPESTTEKGDQKDVLPSSKKPVDAYFALERAFPKLEDLLEPYEFPSLEKSKDVIVALDTSALLLPFEIKSGNLPRLEEVYKRLRGEGRLFVPGRALREFVRNRDKKLGDIVHALNERKGQVSYELPSKLLDSKTLEKANDAGPKKEYKNILGEMIEIIKGWRGNDPVTSMYRGIFREDALIDLSYDKESKDTYLSEFRWRVDGKMPPGIKDSRKDDEGIGDFLIWKSLLKLGEGKKLDLAFVTGEEKADWFVRSDNQRVFPRVELVNEYRRASGGRLLRLLDLNELLRELGVESTVVDEVKRAEEVTNNEIRESRSTTFAAPFAAPSPSETGWFTPFGNQLQTPLALRSAAHDQGVNWVPLPPDSL